VVCSPVVPGPSRTRRGEPAPSPGQIRSPFALRNGPPPTWPRAMAGVEVAAKGRECSSCQRFQRAGSRSSTPSPRQVFNHTAATKLVRPPERQPPRRRDNSATFGALEEIGRHRPAPAGCGAEADALLDQKRHRFEAIFGGATTSKRLSLSSWKSLLIGQGQALDIVSMALVDAENTRPGSCRAPASGTSVASSFCGIRLRRWRKRVR